MIATRPLATYFVLAIAISWALWLPRIASVQGWIDYDVAEWWHYAGAAGPIAAAAIVAAMSEGRRGLARLFGQYSPRRVSPRWLVFAAGSVIALFAVGLVAHRIVEGAWPAGSEIAKTSNLPALGLPLTFAVHLLTFGIGEEAGWRGYALPRLQDRHPALRATLLLAGPWLLWHLPTFFENESFEAMAPVNLAGWAVGLILGGIVLAWLYNSGRGSLVTVAVWHGLFNTLVASEAAADVIAPVITMGVMLMALAAIWLAGPADLTGLSRGGRRVRQFTLPPPDASRGSGAS